jgi:hypothetical protein
MNDQSRREELLVALGTFRINGGTTGELMLILGQHFQRDGGEALFKATEVVDDASATLLAAARFLLTVETAQEYMSGIAASALVAAFDELAGAEDADSALRAKAQAVLAAHVLACEKLDTAPWAIRDITAAGNAMADAWRAAT